MYEKGRTPVIRQISNNVNLYTGREGTPTYIPASIQPIANIIEMGQTVVLYDHYTVGATGFFGMWQVPDNEFWTVRLMTASVSSGTFTLNGFRIRFEPEYTADLNGLPLDPEKWTWGATPHYVDPLYDSTGGKTFIAFDCQYKDLRLPPLAKMFASVDGYSSSGTLIHQSMISREIY